MLQAPVLFIPATWAEANADNGRGIVLDRSKNVYVCGFTASSDFPTTPGVMDTVYNGDGDSFVAKIESSGASLAYSTYFGVSSADRAFALDVNASGQVYLTGDYLVSSPPNYQLNAYVGKMNSAASAWVYLSFLGSAGGDDTGRGIVVDPDGQPIVLGYTTAADFPTTAGAFDTTYNGGYSDVFVAKWDQIGVPVFVTLVGGNNWDFCEDGIALDPSGDIVICGTTDSSDFPTTPAAFDRTINGSYDAFIAKFDPQAQMAFLLDLRGRKFGRLRGGRGHRRRR